MRMHLFFSVVLFLLLLCFPSEIVTTQEQEEEECTPPSLEEGSKKIFERVWEKVERERVGEEMILPKEIIWLMGVPGAGKGTNTKFIMETRGIKQRPIIISELLDDVPEAVEIKARGETMSDDIVLDLLLHALLHPSSYDGVVVDGFPRTKIQVEFVQYLHDTIHKNSTMFKHKPNQTSIGHRRVSSPRMEEILTKYRVCVLHVDERTSVERQLGRGREALAGMEAVRPTDLDEDLALHRYKVFESMLGELLSLQENFPFSVVDADGSLHDVRTRIQHEFDSQEREHMFQHIPKASDVTNDIHHQLINRLNTHKKKYRIFESIVLLIERKIVPSIQRNAFVGEAVVQLQGNLFEFDEELSIQIIVDVLAHQGYLTKVLQFDRAIPDDVNPRDATGWKERLIWELHIKF